MHSIYSSYPLLIDEGSLIRSNQTALLYSLAEGKEKGRLDKELNKADAMVYSTSIFMTSEKSILRLCDQNTGLLVRCLEFEGVTWTRDAESADNIKQVCDSNYGFAIPLIAKKLVEIAENGQKEELLQYYQDCKKKLVQNARNKNEYNSLTERFMKILALIVTGAKIFTESVGVVLDKEMITSFILEHSAIADTEKLDIGNRALEYLCQYISLHHAKFIQSKEWKKDEVHVTPQECKGRIQKIGSKVLNNGETVNAELFISELVFGKILKEGGFQDEKVILKSWKEKGYLHCEKDRYCSKVEIVSQPAVKGYRIYLPVHQVEKIELKKPEGSKSLISRMRADALAKEKALAKEEMEEEVNFECDEDECSEDECFEDREIHSKEIKPLMKKLPRKPPRKPMPPSQVRLLNSKSPLKRLRKEEAEEETC